MSAAPDAVNEIVWHFAGYINLIEELARSRDLYNGSGQQSLQDDFAGKRVADAGGPSGLEDFITLRQHLAAVPNPVKGSVDFALDTPNFDLPLTDPLSGGAAAGRLKTILAEVGGGGGFAFPEPFKFMARVPREFNPPDVEITVTYDDWAAQRIIQATQNKMIYNDNAGYLNADPAAAAKAGIHGLQTLNVAATLDDMFARAKEELDERLPDNFDWPEELNAQPVMDLVKALGDDRKAEAEAQRAAEKGDLAKEDGDAQAESDVVTTEAGGGERAELKGPTRELYINGELQDEGAEHPDVVIPQRTPDVIDTDGPLTHIPFVGVRTETGWNTAYNGAQIVDLNEAGTTLIVKGDYFETNGIIQINVYKDNDQVEIAGLPKESKSITEANEASNVAEFTNEPAFDVLPIGRFHAGLTWNVDVLDGDFVDVKMVSQYNWLYDNGIGVATTNETYSRLLAGGNETLGSATIIDYGKYDVIIVLGDYHEANIIYQKNFLIDDDIVKAASALDEDFEGDITQMASWSANTLLNDATIQNIGAQNFEDLSTGLVDLIDAIGRGEVTFDPEVGWQLTGNGTGTLDILYVTGDYYDVNIVQQTNVVADLDTAIHLLPDLDPGDGTEIRNIISTGENATINTATIIDVGATFHTYLEGEHYEDSILVQAEIVIGDDDDVDRQDTDQLVNEVIAFIGSPDDADDGQPNAPMQGSTLPGDVLGQMMTG
jgi:hypothetical protein